MALRVIIYFTTNFAATITRKEIASVLEPAPCLPLRRPAITEKGKAFAGLCEAISLYKTIFWMIKLNG